MTSTGMIVSVPRARAATAVGAAHPVDLRRAGQPARREHDRLDGRPRPGGEHTTTCSTPAARAVTTPITTVLGYGARPPGT